jgi:hypothetical protein
MIFFCDLLWFFKDLDEINKKEKDKTTVTIANRCYCSKTTVQNRSRVIWPVLQSLRGKLDRFIVEGVN